MRVRRARRWSPTTASSCGWCRSWTGFPRTRKFLLGDRLQTTALEILERLIEATYTKRRTTHLANANLGLEKLRFLIRLARDLRCLDHRRYEFAARSIDDTGRRVGAWRKAHDARQAPRPV